MGKLLKASEKFTVTAPDLEITNIGPVSTTTFGRQKIFVNVKNVGSAELNNASARVVCQAHGISRFDPNKIDNQFSEEWININLSAGGESSFNPSIEIEISTYSYDFVNCYIYLTVDPNPNNNWFTISIP